MISYFSNTLRSLWENELKTHTTFYVLLTTILLSALFVRVYRFGDLLGFYYDQGRDALVIWRLWHEGKFFLIGPVTGLEGIYLGPFYYYMIAPFYIFGNWNPVVPAVFLAFLSILAILLVYYLGYQFHSRATGIIAATIVSFSYFLVLAGRWLSNPTPILLTSVILLWAMWEIIKHRLINNRQKAIWWIVIALTVGISLHFEAASAVFYLPMIVVFALWQRKNLPDFKTVLLSSILFLITLAPQIVFNFRHNNLLLNNFRNEFLGGQGFSLDLLAVFGKRLNYFKGVFSSKIYPGWHTYASVFTILSAIPLLKLVFKTDETRVRKAVCLLLLYLFIPMLGFILYQGNFGNIYDYYMTGYYLPMILLFSIGLGEIWRRGLGKVVVAFFFVSFFMLNGMLLKNYLTGGIDGPTHITLGNQLQAVNWIFEDAEANSLAGFNIDVYVPPVIPHSYDYLFLWQTERRCGEDLCGMVKDRQLPMVYVLYEVDPPHPERLITWLSRYEESTQVVNEVSFGGITVQRRIRI